MKPLGPADPRRVGQYQLLAKLGAGGMGSVYLARSARGRTVAVKLVQPELARQPEFRQRFQQEVDAARRIGKRWTAPVLDCDTDADTPWVATGYVAGPSLHEVVSSGYGKLPERTLLALANGLSQSLRDIHAAGLVHRDLKPSNVLITIDGPRVIDFGIARALEQTGDGLTRTGSAVGSPGFMSPEQCRGEVVTGASDIFCLGSVLAFAATGRTPFGDVHSAMHVLMLRIVQDEKDLSDVPDGTRALIEECLAQDPAERPTLDGLLELTADGDLWGDEHADDDPWLPGSLIARLGKHAVELLDSEDPLHAPPKPMASPTPAWPPSPPMAPPVSPMAAPVSPVAAPVSPPPPTQAPPMAPPMSPPPSPAPPVSPMAAPVPPVTPPPVTPPPPAQSPPVSPVSPALSPMAGPGPWPGPAPAAGFGPPTPTPTADDTTELTAPRAPAGAEPPTDADTPQDDSRDGDGPDDDGPDDAAPVTSTPSAGTPEAAGAQTPAGRPPRMVADPRQPGMVPSEAAPRPEPATGPAAGPDPAPATPGPSAVPTVTAATPPPGVFGPPTTSGTQVVTSGPAVPPPPKPPRRTWRWILAGIGTAMLLVGGFVAIIMLGDDDRDPVAGDKPGTEQPDTDPEPAPSVPEDGGEDEPEDDSGGWGDAEDGYPDANGSIDAEYLGAWVGEVRDEDDEPIGVFRRIEIYQGYEGDIVADAWNVRTGFMCRSEAELVSFGMLLTLKAELTEEVGDYCGSVYRQQTLKARPDGTLIWSYPDDGLTAVLEPSDYAIHEDAVPAAYLGGWVDAVTQGDDSWDLTVTPGSEGAAVTSWSREDHSSYCTWEQDLIATDRSDDRMLVSPGRLTYAEPEDGCDAFSVNALLFAMTDVDTLSLSVMPDEDEWGSEYLESFEYARTG
jgi:serine/threonine protein kinase